MCVVTQPLCPSGSVNRIGGPKQVILAASRNGWEERSPLGGFPLLHFIQVLKLFYLLSMILF